MEFLTTTLRRDGARADFKTILPLWVRARGGYEVGEGGHEEAASAGVHRPCGLQALEVPPDSAASKGPGLLSVCQGRAYTKLFSTLGTIAINRIYFVQPLLTYM